VRYFDRAPRREPQRINLAQVNNSQSSSGSFNTGASSGFGSTSLREDQSGSGNNFQPFGGRGYSWG